MNDKSIPPRFTDAVEPMLNRAPAPQALIGSKIRIKGELYGEEDVLVQGRVEGTIEMRENNLTIGADGHVMADAKAKQIIVEGEVRGDLSGEDKIVIKSTSNVEGNISAPCVSLEEGAKFKGMIDMEPNRKVTSTPAEPKAPKAAESKPAKDADKKAEQT